MDGELGLGVTPPLSENGIETEFLNHMTGTGQVDEPIPPDCWQATMYVLDWWTQVAVV